jgi:hypothetical protein
MFRTCPMRPVCWNEIGSIMLAIERPICVPIRWPAMLSEPKRIEMAVPINEPIRISPATSPISRSALRSPTCGTVGVLIMTKSVKVPTRPILTIIGTVCVLKNGAVSTRAETRARINAKSTIQGPKTANRPWASMRRLSPEGGRSG